MIHEYPSLPPRPVLPYDVAEAEAEAQLRADFEKAHGLDLTDEERAAWVRAKWDQP